MGFEWCFCKLYGFLLQQILESYTQNVEGLNFEAQIPYKRLCSPKIISVVVSQLSQFMHKSTFNHLIDVKRFLQYLKDTFDHDYFSERILLYCFMHFWILI